MKALIIDDDEVILNFAQSCLEGEFPGIEVTLYPTLQRGRPDASFDWSVYDVLLLDYHLGNGETGVGWLRAFAGQPGFPRTVLITAINDPYVVADAIKCGAEGYVNKSDLTPERLVQAVRDVMICAPPEPPPVRTDPGSAAEIAQAFQRERAQRAASSDEAYRFRRVIGRGAMAHVYLAERLSDSSTVVIKVLDQGYSEDRTVVQRFINEAELVSRVHSPYVVKVFDQGFTESFGYIVMEFFGRGDLKQVIERGMSGEEAVVYLYNIAMGLEAIHQAGIVHLDLKPANIMMRADGSLALADFGIAKDLDSRLDLTLSGEVLGTPYYMSPEQIEGGRAEPRSDLYAAGVIFYEMLTGTKPFGGASMSAVLFQHVHAPIPKLGGQLQPYNAVLSGLLAKTPGERFDTAGDLIDALQTLAAQARATA